MSEEEPLTMKTAAILTALLALTGCAVCEQRPVACTVAVALVAGSVAASKSSSSNERERVPTPAALCADGRCL
jgi:hypothetical protein